MKKTTYILLFIPLSVALLSSALVFAQQNKIDSLRTLLKKDKEDTNKVIHFYNLCWEYTNIGSYDTALYYGNVALNLGTKINFKKGTASSYNNIGNIYYSRGNYDKALENHLASLKISEETGDKNIIATSYNNIGNIYYSQGNYDKALENLFAALKLLEEIVDKKGVAFSYHNIGEIPL